MATGDALAPLMGLKPIDNGLGFFAKALDFVKVSDFKRVKFQRTKICVIKNSNFGLDISELSPASEGSLLLVLVQRYCESTHQTIRRKTRTIMVRDVTLGSDHPIRIQTMTTTDAKDAATTVEQVNLDDEVEPIDIWEEEDETDLEMCSLNQYKKLLHYGKGVVLQNYPFGEKALSTTQNLKLLSKPPLMATIMSESISYVTTMGVRAWKTIDPQTKGPETWFGL